MIVLALELLFWTAVGLGMSRWCDHKRLDRISPDLIGFIHRTVERAEVERATTS